MPEERIRYDEVAPDGARALRAPHDYLDHCSLPRPLIDLVYLRTSQINGCAYCVDLHSRDLLKSGMRVEKLVLVPAWREAGEVFTPRERAALRWAESLTRVSTTGAPDEDYEAAAAEFEPKELADLTIAIALMNAYNRLGIGLRKPPQALVALRRGQRG